MLEWFTDTPRLKEERVTPVIVRWMCPKDGCQGEMKSTGTHWPSNPPGYHHVCDACGYAAAMPGKIYPALEHWGEEKAPSSAGGLPEVMIGRDFDLVVRTQNACDQLTRYANAVFDDPLADALETLTDVNDDLWHGRDAGESIDRCIEILQFIKKARKG